jgi:hypothetical protein
VWLEVAPRPLQRRRAGGARAAIAVPALADAVTRSTSTAVATRRMIMQASAVAGYEYPPER